MADILATELNAVDLSGLVTTNPTKLLTKTRVHELGCDLTSTNYSDNLLVCLKHLTSGPTITFYNSSSSYSAGGNSLIVRNSLGDILIFLVPIVGPNLEVEVKALNYGSITFQGAGINWYNYTSTYTSSTGRWSSVENTNITVPQYNVGWMIPTNVYYTCAGTITTTGLVYTGGDLTSLKIVGSADTKVSLVEGKLKASLPKWILLKGRKNSTPTASTKAYLVHHHSVYSTDSAHLGSVHNSTSGTITVYLSMCNVSMQVTTVGISLSAGKTITVTGTSASVGIWINSSTLAESLGRNSHYREISATLSIDSWEQGGYSYTISG